VTVTNLMTGAYQTVISDANYSVYMIDLSSFPGGWQIGDIIRVVAWMDALNGSRDVMITNETAANWYLQIDVQLRSSGGWPPYPYLIAGFTNGTDGISLKGCFVTVTNLRTGAYLTNISDPTYGWYQVDLSTIAGGFLVGDTIRVTATLGPLNGSVDVLIIDSAAPWIQVDVILS